MEEEKQKVLKAIRQAAASLWMDNLPLSKEYVDRYREERISSINDKKNNSPKLVLKRSGNNVRR